MSHLIGVFFVDLVLNLISTALVELMWWYLNQIRESRLNELVRWASQVEFANQDKHLVREYLVRRSRGSE